MKPRIEEQKLTEGQTKAKKPRFKIEKLEERIAPRHLGGSQNRCNSRHFSCGGR
jgi:hypothetical protein